jgi:DNA-binding beta-propeller fold protein YncE
MNRPRRWIGLLCLLALGAIGLSLLGVELNLPLPGGTTREAAVQGVRAVAATPLIRVGAQAPASSELTFLAIEPSGNLLVADRQRQSVLRFDASGHLLAEWGPRLSEDVAIDEPAGIATDGETVYVLDRGRPRLLVLDMNGALRDTISLESLGTYGLNGLALDEHGNVYAADTGRNRILVFSPQGTLLRQIGGSGSNLGQFTQPMALAFAPDGGYVVADWENSRIQRFDPAHAATDAWQTGFRPFGVAVDPSGRVFAPDTDRRRVLVYTQRGGQLAELGGPGGPSIDVAPRQVAASSAEPRALYVLGGQGVVRVDLEDVAAPAGAQAGDEVDLLSPLLLLLLAAVPVAALISRRRGRSARASAVQEARLQSEDGAQRQDQQPGGDQDLVGPVAHQPDHQQ